MKGRWYADRATCTPCGSTGFEGDGYDGCPVCEGTGWALVERLRATGYTADALGQPLTGIEDAAQAELARGIGTVALVLGAVLLAVALVVWLL